MRSSDGRSLAQRAGALLALLAPVCLGGLGLAPSPAQALQAESAPAPTSLTLIATPAVIDHGGVAALSGELSSASVPISAAVLQLSSSPDGSSWSQPATLTTDANGQFTATVSPDAARSSTLYRVAFAGDSALAPAEAEVSVALRVALAAPSVPMSVGCGSSFASSGTLLPRQVAGDAAPVCLACYRLEAGVWVLRQEVSTTISDSSNGSAYAARLSLPAPGSWRLRAVAVSGTEAESWSPWSDTVTVGATPDAPIWNRDGVLSLPERMTSRGDARQLVVVTGAPPRLTHRHSAPLQLPRRRLGREVLGAGALRLSRAQRRTASPRRFADHADRHLALAGLRLRHPRAASARDPDGLPANHAAVLVEPGTRRHLQ